MTNTEEELNAIFRQTWRELGNYVNQTLLTTNFNDSTVMKAYQSILSDAVAQVVAGVKTPQRAINDAIYQQMDKGLKSDMVDKDGNHWALDTYVRMVVNTTAHRTYQDLRLNRAKQYGITTAIMSSHPASRYWCSLIQGKVVELDKKKKSKKYPNIWDYEYHEPAGTQGINCRHTLMVYIPGVTENHETQYDPVQAQANMDTQQKQRALERSIRKDKNKLNVAKELEDEPKIKQFNNQISTKQSALRQLIQNNSFLNRDYSREKPYVSDQQFKINRENFIVQRYDGYVKKFGKHGLPSFAEYKSMVNEKGEELGLFKNYMHAREGRFVEPVADFKLYKEVDQELSTKLKGLKASDGLIISGHSYHAIDRVIGTSREETSGVKRVGVPISEIINALNNGEIKKDEKRGVTMYNGVRASVRVNHKTGIVVTVVPKGG